MNGWIIIWRRREDGLIRTDFTTSGQALKLQVDTHQSDQFDDGIWEMKVFVAQHVWDAKDLGQYIPRRSEKNEFTITCPKCKTKHTSEYSDPDTWCPKCQKTCQHEPNDEDPTTCFTCNKHPL